MSGFSGWWSSSEMTTFRIGRSHQRASTDWEASAVCRLAILADRIKGVGEMGAESRARVGAEEIKKGLVLVR